MRFNSFLRVEMVSRPRFVERAARVLLSPRENVTKRLETMLRNFAVIVFLVQASSLIAAAQIRDPATQSFERGQQKLLKSDFDGAISDFTKVIARNIGRSKDDQPLVGINRISAESEPDTVTFVSPVVAAAYGGRCLARFRKNHLDDALADCDRALAMNPGLAPVYNNRGVIHWVKGNLDSALADFDRVIKINPRDAQAYENRGNVHFDKGNKAAALADLERAIELNPRQATFYCSRGQVRQEIGQVDGGLADCDQALSLEPTLARASYCRGTALYAKQDFTGAAGAFKRATQLAPDMVEAFGNLGAVLLRLGRADEAEKAFAECLTLDPSTRDKLETYRREAKAILPRQ